MSLAQGAAEFVPIGWGDAIGAGTTSLKAISREFTDSKLRSGETEAIVVSNVDGFGVKVRSWSEAF